MDKKPIVDVGVGYAKGKERSPSTRSKASPLDKSMIAVDAKFQLQSRPRPGGVVHREERGLVLPSTSCGRAGTVAADDLNAQRHDRLLGAGRRDADPARPAGRRHRPGEARGGRSDAFPATSASGTNQTNVVTRNTHIMAGIIVNPSKNWQAGIELLNVKTERGVGAAPTTEDKVNQIGVSTRFTF